MGFVVVTHSFHPLIGQRLEVLYLKRRAGEISIGDDGLEGWYVDPYDPALTPADGYLLATLAEDRAYDDRFPEHPLSQARLLLDALIAVE